MSQPVYKVPVKEMNSYDQGKALPSRGTDVKVGPAYSGAGLDKSGGGGLKSNPLKGGGINRKLKSSENMSY